MFTPTLPIDLLRLFTSRPAATAASTVAPGLRWTWPTRRPLRIDLGAGQLWRGRGLAGRRLQVLSGQVWLTEEFRADDCFLRAGEGQVLQGSGRVIASAEGTQSVELELT